jgi:outer membrane protein
MMLRTVLLLGIALSGFAQDSPLALSLKDAVALALKQNPQVILANLNTSQSEQDRLIARSALLPQIEANVTESGARVNLQAAIGVTIPGFPQHVGPYNVFQAGAGLRSPVFDLTLWNRYRAARVGIRAGRAQELAAREESVLLVVSQYLGAQRAAADVAAAQSRADLAQALFNQASDLQKNGAGTGIDTLRANVEFQNEKQRLIAARTQLDGALFALAQLLSIDPRRAISLSDQVSFFDTPPAPEGQTLERAFAERPELRSLQAQEQRAALELKAAGDERLPRLSFAGAWMQQGLTPSTVIPVYQYQASLEVPLFTGGRIDAERAKADLAIRQLKQREQDTRNRVGQEVKTALSQLDAARSEVEVARLGVDLARQEVEQARDRFQAGVANNIEVVSAQDALSRASDNQIGALYRYNQARASLAYATGQMESLYAK